MTNDRLGLDSVGRLRLHELLEWRRARERDAAPSGRDGDATHRSHLSLLINSSNSKTTCEHDLSVRP